MRNNITMKSLLSMDCRDRLIRAGRFSKIDLDTYLDARSASRVIGSSYQAVKKMMVAKGFGERIRFSELLDLYTEPEVRVHPKDKV